MARSKAELTGAAVGLPIGTVTLLLADIEGSTSMWESDPAAMTDAVRRLDAVLADVVARHSGARPVEQGEGDSFVMAFSCASDAVACALDLQLAALSPIRLRVGLHTDEVQLRDEGNYVGPAINRCARLRNLAHGGQTVLSQATHDLVVDRLPDGAGLVDLGSHRMRDLDRPERVFQLSHHELRRDFLPLRSLDAYPHNLPVQLTTFIGRHEEMGIVAKLLRDNRLVTLTGSGGCGKTRLALQVLAAALDQHPDGAWWVDLAAIGDPALVPLAVGEAMRVREVATEDFTVTLAQTLRERTTLILLDNCEHVIEASAQLCDVLLRSCPSLTVLATSREPLGIHGEATWRVPSLSVPAPGAADVASLTACEASLLFIDRASRARPTFELDESNAADVTKICERLDGIPLAIELAAARVRVLSPNQIAAGLDERFRLLAGGSRTALPRQRTLEASVDWSHNLLTEHQRVLFRRLSVFSGTFALDSAEAVCSETDLDAYVVFDVLLQLADRSLVQVENGGRYRMLETIRQYGRMKLIDCGEADSVRDRHVAHFIELTRTSVARIESGGTAEWLPRVSDELDNVRAALDWAISAGDHLNALRLATGWPEFWGLTGHTVEGIDRVSALLDAAEPDDELAALAYVALETMHAYSGYDLASARASGERGLALARSAGSHRVESRATLNLAFLDMMVDPRNAAESLAEARRIAESAGDVWAATRCLVFESVAGLIEGNNDLCIDAGARAEERAREAHDLVNLTHALHYQAWGLVMKGRMRDAAAAFGEALTIAEAIGDHMYGSVLDPAAATTRAFQGEFDGVLEVVEQGLRANLDMQNAWHIGGVLMTKTMCAAAFGQPEAALEAGKEAGAANRSVGLTFSTVASLVTAARAALAAGEVEAGAELVREAASDAGDTPHWLGQVRFAEALLERYRGDFAAATSAAIDALGHVGFDSYVSADAIELLAGLWAASERARDAARLFGVADAARTATGARRWRIDEDRYVDDLVGARDLLGADAFDAAWNEGAAMSLDDAIAYTQRGRGARNRPAAGWSSLTPTELDVVRLVADGLANKEIATKLFISPRTVQAHLTHVYAKLNISSRVQLAREAAARS